MYIVNLTINTFQMTKEFNLNDWEATSDGFQLTVKFNKELISSPMVQVWEKTLNNIYKVMMAEVHSNEDSVTIISGQEFQGRIEIR